MSRRAAQTGPGAMVLVAIEQGFESGERILTDELSGPILPFGSRFWVRLLRPFCGWIVNRTEAKVPGLWGGIMARKRYIDDALDERYVKPSGRGLGWMAIERIVLAEKEEQSSVRGR